MGEKIVVLASTLCLLFAVGLAIWKVEALIVPPLICPNGIASISLGESLQDLTKRHGLQPTDALLGVEVQERLVVADASSGFDAREELVSARSLWRPIIGGREAICTLEFDQRHILVQIACEMTVHCEPVECVDLQTETVLGLEERYGKAHLRTETPDQPVLGIVNQMHWQWTDAQTRFQAHTSTLLSPTEQTIARVRLETTSMDHLEEIQEVKLRARTRWAVEVPSTEEDARSLSERVSEALLIALEDPN